MYAIVNKNIGYIKSSPNFEATNTDEILYGMKVEILNTINAEWYYIKTHYNYEGYINKGDLIMINDINEYSYDNNSVCISSFADILDNPKYNGVPIITLTRGAQIMDCNLLYDQGKFTKVKLVDNRDGYIRSSFIKKNENSYNKAEEFKLRNSIAESALSYLGTQYRWGGKTPLGIDCSGLCSMAYMLNGILIYRDAKIKEGFPIKEISFNKVKIGDLLFFKNHVAMYLGKDQYIHSSDSNNVVMINSFNKTHYNYFEKLDNKLLAVGSIF